MKVKSLFLSFLLLVFINISANAAIGTVGMAFSTAFVPITVIGGVTTAISQTRQVTYSECRDVRYDSMVVKDCIEECEILSDGPKVCETKCYNRLPLYNWGSRNECVVHYSNRSAYSSFFKGLLLSIGLIILDDSQNFTFSQISRSDATSLKVSEFEMNQYNDKVEELNIISEEVTFELNEMENKGSKVNLEISRELWNKKLSFIDESVKTVVQKIANQFIENIEIEK